MKTETHTFKNRSGRLLSAILDSPDKKPAFYAIIAHCFTCTKNFKSIRWISEALALHGIASLSFDFTGLGHSEGDFSETNFTMNVHDIEDAAKYLSTIKKAPSLLIGHSLGGSAVLAAAGKIPSAKAVVTIASPSNLEDVSHDLAQQLEHASSDASIDLEVAGKSYKITKQMVDDFHAFKLNKIITALNKPLLIFHSPADKIVSVDNAAEIFKAAKHPKSFVSLDNADHLLSKREDSHFIAEIAAAWSARYIL